MPLLLLVVLVMCTRRANIQLLEIEKEKERKQKLVQMSTVHNFIVSFNKTTGRGKGKSNGMTPYHTGQMRVYEYIISFCT